MSKFEVGTWILIKSIYLKTPKWKMRCPEEAQPDNGH